jgi:hypothetical protein
MGAMDERPLPPWTGFSGSFREFSRTPANRTRFFEWLRFLRALPRIEQLRYVRDFPAPQPGWEIWYTAVFNSKEERRERREHRKLLAQRTAMIAKMWQSTTLK